VEVGVALPGWIDTDLVRDAREDLASFDALIQRLPGPLSVITSVSDCAEAFAGAIERRQRKLFVPRSLAILAAMRTLFWGPLGHWLGAREAAKSIPELERQVGALGRSYGKHSVGAGKPVESAPGKRATS
jgi:hypothetical protein